MSAVQFNNSGSATDRRRRRLVAEMEPEIGVTDPNSTTYPNDDAGNNSAFPMLSRDRLVRRMISPRLWKHITVAVVLTFTPIIFAIVTWPASLAANSTATATLTSQLDALRGLSGLKLFAAAQFCLVIGWVRSASAVDFRGRYRWWRWMAIGLFATSLLLLTGSTEFFVNLAGRVLEPLFGKIEAARPALIIVPAGACLALVLRRLIPDMGRCRLAQSLVVCSTVLLIVRAFAGARLNSAADVFHLTTLELLISGLLLSAFQLHARYVIHVNPNPPLAVERKTSVLSTQPQIVNSAAKTVSSMAPVTEDSEFAVSEVNRVASCETTVEQIEPVSESASSESTTTRVLSVAESVATEAAKNTQIELHSKGKSDRKQKLRKAS